MKTLEVSRNQIQTDEDIEKAIVKVSKENPDSYVTANLFLRKLEIYIHGRKPQSITSGGAENSYRHYGGFHKNGSVVKPSNSFMKKYDFAPVLG